MLSLVMSGDGDFPIWMESQNGNSSDKVSFHNTIANVRKFEKNLDLEPSIWIADSALYTKERLLKPGEVYLKKPERIEALLFVIVLCLLVYNFAQNRLRQNLLDKNDTLPNQLGKQTNQPTFRWIMEMMSGIGIVYIQLQDASQIIVTNLNDTKRKIISYFGRYAQKIYGMG
jgi:transposase